MKNKTRLISLVLLTLTLIAAFAYQASAAGASVKIDQVYAKRGETITLNVTLSGSSAANTLGITLKYDKNVLELDKNRTDWLLTGALLSDFNKQNEEGAITYAAAKDLNGKVFQMVFKVKANAPLGKTEVSCDFIVKNNSTVISNTVTAGGITVTCAHAMTETKAAPATCTKDGNRAYFYCSVCKKYFSDSTGLNQTTVEASKIKAPGHAIGKVSEKAPDCGNEGNKAHYRCANCSECYSDAAGKQKIDANSVILPADGKAHKLSEIKAESATCSKEGHIAYRQCAVCEKKFASGNTEKELSEEEIRTNPLPHTPCETIDSAYLSTPSTCENGAVYFKSCSVCKIKLEDTFVDGSSLGHNYTYLGISYEKHSLTCPTCSESHEEEHKWGEPEVKSEASESGDGLTVYTCKDCGYQKCEITKLLIQKEEVTGSTPNTPPTTQNPAQNEDGKGETVLIAVLSVSTALLAVALITVIILFKKKTA